MRQCTLGLQFGCFQFSAVHTEGEWAMNATRRRECSVDPRDAEA